MAVFVVPFPHFSSFHCVVPQIQNVRIILEFFLSTDLHFLCMTNVYLVSPTSNNNTYLNYICNINMCACSVAQSCSCLATPWTVTLQAPLSMRFCRQEYWIELPCPLSGFLPHPGIKPGSPASPVSHALARGFFTTESPEMPIYEFRGYNTAI